MRDDRAFLDFVSSGSVDVEYAVFYRVGAVRVYPHRMGYTEAVGVNPHCLCGSAWEGLFSVSTGDMTGQMCAR